MKQITELNNTEAKAFFLKEESYFNFDLPQYFVFQKLLEEIDKKLNGRPLSGFYGNYITGDGKQKPIYPFNCENVNYILLNNKDGKFAWRPLQLIHPAIYIFLIQKITDIDNWEDFYRQKIMYSEIVREPQFYLDEGEFSPEATTFILTGEHLEFLYHVFHTKAVTYFFKTFYAGGGLGENGYRYKKKFLENLPIPKPAGNIDLNNIETCLYKLYNLSEEEIKFIECQ